MPANTVSLINPSVGDLLLPANAYRVMLVFNDLTAGGDIVLIGPSLANGIPMLGRQIDSATLLLNVMGTAMQGEVTVYRNQSFANFNLTEITRTPAGTT